MVLLPGRIDLSQDTLDALEQITVTVTNPITGFAEQATLAAVLTELQTQQKDGLTDAQLRAADVKVSLDGEPVALDAATLAALEDITVTVANPITGFATQTTLAALLTELQTQQKDALTDAQLRASPVPTTVTGTSNVSVVGRTVRFPISPVNSKKKTQVNVGTTPVRVLVVPLANRVTLAIRNLDKDVALFYGHNNLITATAGTMLIDPKEVYIDEIGTGVETWLVSAGKSLSTNTQTLLGGSTANVVNVTTPGNALVDNPSAAVFTAQNSSMDVVVNDFTFIPPHNEIQSVKVRTRMKKSAGGGTDPVMRISYRVGATVGESSLTQTLTDTISTEYELDITGDRTWDKPSLDALELIATQIMWTNRESNIEFIRVEVVEVELGGLIRVALDESAEAI